MATRFIGKNLRKKVIKPLRNSAKYPTNSIKPILEDSDVVHNKIENQKKENKKQKKNKEMVNENKLSQLETIVGTATTANIKVEKSDKGLYERTENSTILITEDNKMLLND